MNLMGEVLQEKLRELERVGGFYFEKPIDGEAYERVFYHNPMIGGHYVWKKKNAPYRLHAKANRYRIGHSRKR